MSLQEAISSKLPAEGDLNLAIEELASPDVPLIRPALDQLATRVLASGSASLCAALILTLEGRGAVPHARELADRCIDRFPNDRKLARVRDLIAPPRIVPPIPHPRVDRRADLDWLRDHAAEYPGEWLVLSGGRLWAHSPSLAEAQDQAQAAGLGERPLLHHVDAL